MATRICGCLAVLATFCLVGYALSLVTVDIGVELVRNFGWLVP